MSRMAAYKTATAATQDDEYTDYSCSTSIEHLSRDVETRLRKWHIDQGSDRHVSVQQQQQQQVAPSPRSNRRRGSLSNATSGDNAFSAQMSSSSSVGADLLSLTSIRSERFRWQFSCYLESRQRFTWPIDLELTLWDGPPQSARPLQQPAGASNDLPFSLQRPGTLEEIANDPFANFSVLFGVGQHITLCPVDVQEQHQTDSLGIPDQILQYLTQSILQRHDKYAAAPDLIVSVLTNWLQTALNWAASSSGCCFPVFALWGSYQPTANSKSSLHLHVQPQAEVESVHDPCRLPIPSWMSCTRLNRSWSQHLKESIKEHSLSFRRRGRRSLLRRSPVQRRTWNEHSIPPFMTGHLLSSGVCRSTFWCMALADGQEWRLSIREAGHLSLWGAVLLEHCRQSAARGGTAATSEHEDDNDSVALWAARHVHVWSKAAENRSAGHGLLAAFAYPKKDPHAWRGIIAKVPPEPFNSMGTSLDHPIDLTRSMDSEDEEEGEQVKEYRRQCRRVATLLTELVSELSENEPMWGPPEDPVSSFQAAMTWKGRQDEQGKLQPLIYLPLRTRTRQTMTQEEWLEVDRSVETTLLNPHETHRFSLSVHFDRDMAQATLAASQRCVLAALVRTATLPRETLIHHLVDAVLMEQWDSAAGNHIARTIADKAKLDPSVKILVDAMDWSHAAEDMLETYQAEGRVRRVMDGRLTMKFPFPPDRLETTTIDDEWWKPFLKAGPPGRLVSLLFVNMASARSPSSMALIWLMFVREVRKRWDDRESLPNMTFIPALDPTPEVANSKRCVSTVGMKANFAAHLSSYEPDPDDYHCLIGQKLQVRGLHFEVVCFGVCCVCSHWIVNFKTRCSICAWKV